MKNELSIGFIILSVDLNVARLKSTNNSIRAHFGDASIVCVADKSVSAEEYKKAKDICNVYKGQNTVTSLINTGFKHAHKEWNVLIMEGTWVRPHFSKKYLNFVESEKDILFPVTVDYDVQGKPKHIYNTFWNCSLNGLMIHHKTFKEVGQLEDGDLENSRLIWAASAQEKNCKFKAILGVKLC